MALNQPAPNPESSRPMATQGRVANMQGSPKGALDLRHGGATAVGVGMDLMLVAVGKILPDWLGVELWWLLFAIGFGLFIYGVSPFIVVLLSIRSSKMIALAGMIVFGLGFVGSAAVYFWPSRDMERSRKTQ